MYNNYLCQELLCIRLTKERTERWYPTAVAEGVDLQPKLTHVQLTLYICFAGEFRSDRRGVIKRNQTMAFP